jgi:hypothetical protein
MDNIYDTMFDQLPAAIADKLTILVIPCVIGERPDVILSDKVGRQWIFKLEEDDKIPELIILQLCVQV